MNRSGRCPASQRTPGSERPPASERSATVSAILTAADCVTAELCETSNTGRGNGALPPTLLDRVREAIRVRHYSRRTEEASVTWIRRFILFHGKRHPWELRRERWPRSQCLSEGTGCTARRYCPFGSRGWVAPSRHVSADEHCAACSLLRHRSSQALIPPVA